jgi:hypothetical protein
MAKEQREVEERNDTGLSTLMKGLVAGYAVRRGKIMKNNKIKLAN